MDKSWTSKPSLTTSRIHTAKYEDNYQSPRLYKHDSASRSRYTPIYPFFTHNPPHSYINLSVRVLTCLQICSPATTKFALLHTRASWTTTITNAVPGEPPRYFSHLHRTYHYECWRIRSVNGRNWTKL